MPTLQIAEIGWIKEIRKNIVKVSGMSNCLNGQLLDIAKNSRGMVMGFNEGEVLVLLLGNAEGVKVGDKVYNRMEPFLLPAGEGFIGRIVNALAEPMDGKGAIQPSAKDFKPRAESRELKAGYYPVFREAPGVLQRVPITRVFETGNLVIDTVIPIGKGQRELIIGDRMTGKTSICIDAILNQKGKGVICIYCYIGRSYSSLKKIIETFKKKGILDYTIVVSATASSSGGEQYLAPYTACALGEYFMYAGRDVFVVFDDLTKHAWAYRQLSLLLERAPGRDAYPGDIFYLHSQLMERAGKLNPENGDGSMTFFPIVDTLQGDITGYLPSNLVSMTDGQIYLSSALFNSGIKPAIDLGLSVSRIGNKAQCPAMKELSAMLRLEYLQYNELLKVTRFKTNISEDVIQQLKHGEIMIELFIQDKNNPVSLAEELMFLYALRRKMLDTLSRDEVGSFKSGILKFVKGKSPALIKELLDNKKIDVRMEGLLDSCINNFLNQVLKHAVN